MMKKLVGLLLCMGICMSFAACSQQEEGTSAGSEVIQEPQSSEVSQVSSMPAEVTQEPESSQQAEPKTETAKFAQVDAYTGEDSAKAYLTLNTDNTFVLEVEFYDGMPQITGTYQFENGTYVMSQLETNTEAIQLSGIQTMKFVQSGENLIYEGDSIEQTVSGVEFKPVEQ